MSMLNNVKLVRVPKPQFKKYLYDPSEFKLDYDDCLAHPDEKTILRVDFWEDILNLLEDAILKKEGGGRYSYKKETIDKVFFSGELMHWDMYYHYLKPKEVKEIARLLINLTRNDFKEVFDIDLLQCTESFSLLEDGSEDEKGIFNDLMSTIEELQRFYAFAAVNKEGLITFRI